MASFVLTFFALLVATFITNGCCDVGTPEATLLALEYSGQLLAPKALIQKFTRELKAIRTAYPEVAQVGHSPRWRVGVLIAKVGDEQLEQIRIQYGEVTQETLFDDYTVLTFTAQYNPEVLAKELTSQNLVDSAEPDFIIGASSGIGYDTRTRIYTFTAGEGDCPAGCINKYYWEFYVFYNRAFKLREYSSGPVNGGIEVAEEAVDATV